MTQINYLQGSKISEAPHSPGLYAWYFRPLDNDHSLDTAKVLTRLLAEPPILTTQINLRYRVRWIGNHPMESRYGASEKSPKQVVSDLMTQKGSNLASFFRHHLVPIFSRPLYIGIASKSLHERVYEQHFLQLNDYWLPDHKVNKYLVGSPDATVQQVMNETGEQHSFSLEARVGGITPTNLAVYTLPISEIISTDSADTRKADLEELEDILQLLSDPLCGRE